MLREISCKTKTKSKSEEREWEDQASMDWEKAKKETMPRCETDQVVWENGGGVQVFNTAKFSQFTAIIALHNKLISQLSTNNIPKCCSLAWWGNIVSASYCSAVLQLRYSKPGRRCCIGFTGCYRSSILDRNEQSGTLITDLPEHLIPWGSTCSHELQKLV